MFAHGSVNVRRPLQRRASTAPGQRPAGGAVKLSRAARRVEGEWRKNGQFDISDHSRVKGITISVNSVDRNNG